MASVIIEEHISFGGWDHCVRIRNSEIELIITTDIGPRILYCGFRKGENLLYIDPKQHGKCGGADWRIYGGHRLWLSPETYPATYFPDNEPVPYFIDNNKLVLTAQVELFTGISKELEISFHPATNEVTLVHRLLKQRGAPVEIAPWAITAFAPGGYGIIPQEPFIDENDHYLPARPLVLWHYTEMNDPRWTWGKKHIIARHDPANASAQKIGVLNQQNWAAYYLHGHLLTKRFETLPNAIYPDFGCNTELYMNEKLLEVETLGPLATMSIGSVAVHTETWELEKMPETWLLDKLQAEKKP